MTERKRKKLLSWFPREGKFQTKDEVDAYFTSDKIQCLLCGKWFQRIGGNHLKFKHGITSEDYKEMFGLPWVRGLTGALNYARNIELGKRNYAKMDKELMLRRLHLAKPSPPRAHQPFRKDWATTLGLAVGGRRTYRRKDFEAILERMREQERTANDVCRDPGMPSEQTLLIYFKEHPEFREKYREVLYDLPYSLQARSFDFSPRLSIDCQKMRAGGIGMRKIGKALGIGPKAVKRILEESLEGFRLLDPRRSTKWRLEDFEAVLDRIKIQQRTLNDACGDPDLPSIDSWGTFVKRHPDFEKKARELQIRLSYPLQFKTGSLSPRFRIDCQRLRARGMSVLAIARALGSSETTVRRTLQDIPGGFRPLDNIHSDKRRSEDFEALLERMRKQQRILIDVCGDPDLPGIHRWMRFIKKHSEFRGKIREIQLNFPYPLQATIKCISPRFGIDCQRLRARGMMMHAIAEALGVSKNLVSRSLRESPGGFRHFKRIGVKKWRRRDFEAVLDRMRRQKRLLTDVCGDPDVPGHECLNTYAKKHPEFREKIKQTYYSLPYSLQSKGRFLSPQLESDCRTLRARGIECMLYTLQVQGRVLSPQLVSECQRLRARGFSVTKIAKSLGLRYSPVKRILQKSTNKDLVNSPV